MVLKVFCHPFLGHIESIVPFICKTLQFINVNDFGIFCGGYHYKFVDEIEDDDDGGNFDMPRLRRATNEARSVTLTSHQRIAHGQRYPMPCLE